MKIRFCKHGKGARQACQQLQQDFPDLNIKLKDCQKQCKHCREQPLAVVNKVRVISDSWDDLLKHLHETIKNSII